MSADSAPQQDHDHVLQHDHDEAVARLSTAFFSRPPREHEPVVWDDAPQPAMPHETRRAMHATLVILIGSVLAISGYAAYTHFVLPVPVELGAASGLPPPPAALPAPLPPEPVAVHLPAAPAPAVPALPPPAAAPPSPAPSETVTPSPRLRPGDPVAPTPGNAGPTPRDAALAQQVAAASYIQLNAKHNLRARELAERAVALDDTSSEAWIVLGAARGALGDHRGAREAYRSCAERAVGEYALECRRLAR
ncbi:MAG: hypothetical protein ACHQ53_08325 [Polyangiales bacterium]